MDAGRRDEEDRPGTAAAANATLSAHHFDDHRLQYLQHHRDDTASDPSQPPHGPAYPDYHNLHDPPHHRREFSAYAADNFAAYAANSSLGQPPGGPGANDYYSGAHNYDDTTDFADSDCDDLMASALPAPRHPASTPRSSRHGAAPTKPSVPPSAVRPTPKTGFRSVSAPADEKALAISRARAAAASSGGHKTSVKDLKKRFDFETAQRTPASNRSAAPRASSRGPVTPASSRGVASSPISGSYATLRSSVTSRDLDEPSTSTRSTQRARAVTEDNVSSNPQSFASRVHKPRMSRESTSSLPAVGKSRSRPASPGRLSSPKHNRGLLFGEVVPGHSDVGNAGFGIEGFKQSGAHDSRTQNSKLHVRSMSQSEVEPPSPSDWYRETDAAMEHQRTEDSRAPSSTTTTTTTTTKKHTRAHSDDAYKKTMVSRSKPIQSSRPPPTSSRLPVAIKNNLSASSSSASPPSSRANSPAFARRQAQTQSKTTGTSSTTASKGSHAAGTTSRRAHPTIPSLAGSNNNRLNAFIGTPPPKLSPPLRSSRPRQPVSTASTASSRLRAAENQRGKSPSRADPKSSTKHLEPGTRRRKISMGPIDFESRREQIKLSYSKSMKETEARAAARRLAEGKRKEKVPAAEVGADEPSLPAPPQVEQPEPEQPAKADGVQVVETLGTGAPVRNETPTVEQPVLTITTDLRADLSNLPPVPLPAHTAKSPEFELPGSFPSLATPPIDRDEAPPSAVSDTTEFDNEPQTEPPVAVLPPNCNPESLAGTESLPVLSQFRSEYRSPFDDDSPRSDRMSIKITLEDVIDPVHSSVAPTPTDTEFDLDQNLADSCDEDDDGGNDDNDNDNDNDDDEYVPRPLVSGPSQTTVTIIGRNTDFSPPGSASASQHLLTPNAHPQETGLGLQRIGSNGPSLVVQSPDPYFNDDQSAGLNKLESYFTGPQAGSGAQGSAPVDEYMHAHHLGTTIDSLRDDASLRNESAAGFDPDRSPRFIDSPSMPNRSSQASNWTDYSVQSRRTHSGYPDKHGHSELHSLIAQRTLSHSPDQPLPFRSTNHDEALRGSLSSMNTSPRDTSQGFAYAPQQTSQLPSVDTGASFVVHYAGTQSAAELSKQVPNHPPPRPPFSDSPFRDGASSAPPSEYYPDTRPSSFAQVAKDDQSEISLERQRPGSEVFTISESAARSTDQVSIATSEGPPTGTTPPDANGSLPELMISANADALDPKEKKRLFTRLQTIKELIDTEAFFIRDMNIVEEIYKGTAEACPQLDDNTIKLIFRNTDEIIAFHNRFLAELKEGVASIYVPRSHRNRNKGSPLLSDGGAHHGPTTATAELSDEKDRETSLGPIFIRNMEVMKATHETFLKNSDLAAKRLIQIQEDPTVKVWLNECNEVARDLTKAWNLDSLLIKPMQRITKYPNLLIQLLGETPADHADRAALVSAKELLETAIEEINKTKKNFELVGQIVGNRKRKDSDVRAGFARAFGKRVDKLQPASNRPEEDADYNKYHEKFGDDYLRLQVVLRDVEYYTRQVSEYVHIFLQFLSSMELVMRLQPSPHPEIESKWVRFNVSMRDIEKVALAQHLSQVRKQVIEPFEHVIKSYGNPSLAMKKRAKRRLDFEKSIQLKKNNKKIDKQTADAAEQYEALNETLKKELPKLSALTEKVGNICLGNLINIQTQWYSIWKDKVKSVLDDATTPEIADIIMTFSRDYKFQEEQISAIGIVNPASKGRPSQSASTDEPLYRLRPRPSDLSPRGRGLSINSDTVPSLPTPDFMKRHSGQFTMSPTAATLPSPSHQYYRDYYTGASPARPAMQATAMTSEGSQSGRSMTAPARPGTGHSHDSSTMPRQSTDSSVHVRSSTTSVQPSPYLTSENHRFSGLFQSALPLPDKQERLVQPRPSRASSRASSREREPINGYNVLWLAASLFEFNIETTKTEAGYPYLTYQAGEIFDVIGEKGELWLAKNQDDPSNLVGWLWSKHFAKLADD